MVIPLGNEGDLDGATPVTLLAPPASGWRRVLPVNGITFHNADTDPHDFTIQKRKGAATYVKWIELAVPAGTTISISVPMTLDAADESAEAKIEGAHTTTAPTFDVSAGEMDGPIAETT